MIQYKYITSLERIYSNDYLPLYTQTSNVKHRSISFALFALEGEWGRM